MTRERCLITLAPLKESERPSGMSRRGIKALFAQRNAKPALPFTRKEFIEEKPFEQKGMSISGAQPKLSLVLNYQGELEVVDDGGTYILKPSPEAFPNLAENEHAIMSCMKALGFEVPEFGLIPFASPDGTDEQELAFIIARYDREGESRIHQEQIDGAMAIEDKYGKEGKYYTVSYEQVGDFITREIDTALSVRRDYFKRVVCAYLFGNNDFHLRNIGVMHPAEENVYITPVYDFVSVAPYPALFTAHLALPLLKREEYDHENADGYDSKYGDLVGYDFIECAAGFDIKPALAKKYIEEVVAKEDKLIEIVQNSYMTDEHKHIITQHIRFKTRLLRVFDCPEKALI
ncbi:type II toxin-antitoxin system HipA family toxin [Rosenbergiella metrosideri]|uniref:type II toxin-antitoxin system HipA family toxin n=1 Tax=Rosenbergiella metrosideri TaxID=2921185 RepID=UPI001F4FF44A|nr:HipA domain-containing protein [Rosenbergiella metrosideri]